MKLAVVGSRGFDDYKMLSKYLNNYEISKIISGGAQGADKLAEFYAKEKNIPICVYYAEWNKYGKSAGPIRNKKIIDDSDRLIAFWDGKSHGTLNSIKLAERKNIPIQIVRF